MRAKIDARGRAIHPPNDSRFTIRPLVGANNHSPLSGRLEGVCDTPLHGRGGCCVTHKACVASLTKPALRPSQSLRCVTHKACVACKPLGKVLPPRWGKGFPDFVGANNHSPPRPGTCIQFAQAPCQHAHKHLVSMRASTLSACAQAPCQHARKHLVSMRTSTLSACVQAPCTVAHKHLVQ